jgi:hypothetical protein
MSVYHRVTDFKLPASNTMGPDNQGLFPCLTALQKGGQFEQAPQSLVLLKVLPMQNLSDLTRSKMNQNCLVSGF